MIDKERLEEIKNSYLEGLHRLFGTPWVSMPKENFDFLIKQAERVEKLETQYERYKQALEEIRGLYPLRNVGYQVSEIRKIVIKALEVTEK